MDSGVKTKIKQQKKRVLRVRKNLRGSSERPRMCVVKSNLNIHIQLIDDVEGHTLASVSTISKEFKGSEQGKRSKESAKALGMSIAKKAKEKNIESVIFDRGRHRYHGIVAAVADGAREGGLQF